MANSGLHSSNLSTHSTRCNHPSVKYRHVQSVSKTDHPLLSIATNNLERFSDVNQITDYEIKHNGFLSTQDQNNTAYKEPFSHL